MTVLRTPEQVAADLGPDVSPHTVRRLIREGKVAYTPLARGKFYMTDEQVDAMLQFLAVAPKAPKARPARGASPFKSNK